MLMARCTKCGEVVLVKPEDEGADDLFCSNCLASEMFSDIAPLAVDFETFKKHFAPLEIKKIKWPKSDV